MSRRAVTAMTSGEGVERVTGVEPGSAQQANALLAVSSCSAG